MYVSSIRWLLLTGFRCGTHRLFSSGAYACTHRQIQLASTSTPRSAISSVTCSYDSGYRRYRRTHKMINSPGCCRPLNGLLAVIGIDFYPTRTPAAKFATEPFKGYAALEKDFGSRTRIARLVWK